MGPADDERRNFYRALGSLLRDAREHRPGGSLTQQEVAASLGVTQTTISDYESGRRRVNPYDLARLCRLLALRPDQALFPDRGPLGLLTTGTVPAGQGADMVAEASPAALAWPGSVRLVELDAPADVHLTLETGDVLLIAEVPSEDPAQKGRAPAKVVGALRKSAVAAGLGPTSISPRR